MKVLVTGGAGFIGSHLVDSLIERGNQVFVVDNMSNSSHKFVHPKAELSVWSVLDFELEKSFDDFRPDTVVHLAAQTDVTTSVEDPILDAQENVLGMLNVLEMAVKYKVKKLVFSSSGGAIYGENDILPATEETPALPMCPYGTSKLCSEEYIKLYSRLYNLKYSILRFSNVYGPRQKPADEGGVVAIFSMNLLKNKQSRIFGKGNQTRDFVYVQDVVEAIILGLNSEKDSITNISTGIETSVNTLFEKLSDIHGSSQKPDYQPERKGEVLRSALSYEKAEKILGYTPKTSLEEGLKKTLEFFRESSQEKK